MNQKNRHLKLRQKWPYFEFTLEKNSDLRLEEYIYTYSRVVKKRRKQHINNLQAGNLKMKRIIRKY